MSIDYSGFAFPKPSSKPKKEIKPIKKKSSKLAKKERKRFSIIQDKKICFLCGSKADIDTHEAFGGRNRQKSMKYGLIFYLCRKCHRKIEDDTKGKKNLQEIAKRIFIKKFDEKIFKNEFF